MSSSIRVKHACSILTAIAILLSSTIAGAQSGTPRSAVIALDRQAAELFEIEDYEQALELLEAAQHLAPSTVRVYNIAVCQERIGRLNDALASYRRFVYEANATEERLDEAYVRIERLRGLIEETAPTEEPTVFGSESSSESREPSRRQRLSPVIFYSLLGVTAASGIGLVASGAVALHYQSEFENTVVGSAQGDDFRARGEPWVVASNVLLGVTLACALTTVIVAIFTRWHSTPSGRRSVRLALGP